MQDSGDFIVHFGGQNYYSRGFLRIQLFGPKSGAAGKLLLHEPRETPSARVDQKVIRTSRQQSRFGLQIADWRPGAMAALWPILSHLESALRASERSCPTPQLLGREIWAQMESSWRLGLNCRLRACLARVKTPEHNWAELFFTREEQTSREVWGPSWCAGAKV